MKGRCTHGRSPVACFAAESSSSLHLALASWEIAAAVADSRCDGLEEEEKSIDGMEGAGARLRRPASGGAPPARRAFAQQALRGGGGSSPEAGE